ncbi:MAG TPA: hypothetical protein VJX94_29735 [Stellaceae bacterium]|nr:hypothetical protein [Stellaceae bacterium]
MLVRKYQFIALAFLGFCLLPLLSCAPSGSTLQSYTPASALAPGMARVWFLRTKDPQEQFGDPIIFANGNQVGRSIPGIAFYHDFPPGAYAFTVQSYGLTAAQPIQRDTVQLAPGTQTYLEILWGGSWLVGQAGGATFYVRTLPPELDQAYLRMLTDKGPPQAM